VKISIKGGARVIAAGDAPVGARLMVIFARCQDPRREEGGPDWRRVQGNGDSGSRTRRCAVALEDSGPSCPVSHGESPRPRPSTVRYSP
jgi:hypothetical protein